MIIFILHWASRLILAGTFLYTGYIKLQSPLQFAAILSGYQLFPEPLILPLTDYFPWVEMGLGILLLSGWKIRHVALGACGLLLAFTAILTITYLRGIEANCGCFSFDDRITPLTIGRDMLILIPALFLTAEPRLRPRLGPTADPAR
ncbi:MAG: DoxX family membrane protein [Acidobacteria bacterium]|nr:DoxX family membrane protein [Acidobacteriota bacterium]